MSAQAESVEMQPRNVGGSEHSFNREDAALSHDKFIPRSFSRNFEHPDYVRYLQATVFLEDAKYGNSTDHNVDFASLIWYRWYHSSTPSLFFGFNLFVNVCLVFLESPATFPIQKWIPHALEICTLLIFLYQEWIKFRTSGGRVYFRNAWNLTLLVLIGINLFATIVAFHTNSIHWSRFARCYYIVNYSSLTRRAVESVFRAIPDIFKVLALVFIIIVVFVIMCLLVYSGTSEACKWYNDFYDGFWHTLVMLSTANFPNVMLEAVNDNRANAIPFMLFMIVCLFFLLSLVLATIYSKFKENMEKDIFTAMTERRTALALGFYLLDVKGNKRIELDAWRHMFAILRPLYSVEKTDILFSALDSKSDGVIDEEEYTSIIDILNLRVISTHKTSNVFQRCFPGLYDLSFIKTCIRFIRSKVFDYLINIIIFGNSLFLLITTVEQTSANYNRILLYPTVNSSPNALLARCLEVSSQISLSGGAVSIMFTSIYVVEMILKVLAIGPSDYWKVGWNRYDCLVTIGALLAVLLQAGGAIDGVTIRVFTLFRVFRLFRIIFRIKSYQKIIDTLRQTVSAVLPYFLLLFSLYYFYALLGMSIWGGRICTSPDPQCPEYNALISSDFGSQSYWPVSFNSFWESMITLFSVMVVNNWNVTVSGYVAISGRSARAFFILFYIMAVLIFLNIIIAIVLDAYSCQEDAAVQNLNLDMHVQRLEELASEVNAKSDDAFYIVRKPTRTWDLLMAMYSAASASAGTPSILSFLPQDRVEELHYFHDLPVQSSS